MLSHLFIKPWNGAFYNPLIQITFWNLISHPKRISYIAVIVSDQDIFIAKSRCFLGEHLLLYSLLYRFLSFAVWDSFVWIQSFYVSFQLPAFCWFFQSAAYFPCFRSNSACVPCSAILPSCPRFLRHCWQRGLVENFGSQGIGKIRTAYRERGEGLDLDILSLYRISRFQEKKFGTLEPWNLEMSFIFIFAYIVVIKIFNMKLIQETVDKITYFLCFCYTARCRLIVCFFHFLWDVFKAATYQGSKVPRYRTVIPCRKSWNCWRKAGTATLPPRLWCVRENCFPLWKPWECLLIFRFVFGIGISSCFIRHNDRRIFQHRPCDCDALFFPAGKSGAVRNNRLIAVRKRFDRFMDICSDCRIACDWFLYAMRP